MEALASREIEDRLGNSASRGPDLNLRGGEVVGVEDDQRPAGDGVPWVVNPPVKRPSPNSQ